MTMHIGSTMTRRRIVDRDPYQHETKPWPRWKVVAGSIAVAVAILIACALVAVGL